MGLAQAAADDASGDFAGQFERMKAGASLISIAQEVLGIKGKKLPIASISQSSRSKFWLHEIHSPILRLNACAFAIFWQIWLYLCNW